MSTCDSDEERAGKPDAWLDPGVAMTMEEIAAAEGISKQRVDFLLQRGLAKLKAAFEARGLTFKDLI